MATWPSPAGVHDIDFSAEIRAPSRGGEGQSLRLLDRQGIHVGAQRHNRTGPPPAQDADHPGSRNTSPDLQAQAAQVLRNQSGCALFLVAEFGVGMDVPPPGDHLSFLRSGLLRDFLLEARRLGCEGNHRAAPCESERDQAAEGFGRGHASTSRAMAVQPGIVQLRPKNGTWVPVENRRDKLLRALHRSESARTETRKSGNKRHHDELAVVEFYL